MQRLTQPMQLLRGLLASLAACTLIACGGGGSDSGISNPGGSNPPSSPPTVATKTTLTGLVQDAAGVALAGASVSAAGQTLTTANDGSYTFSLDANTTTTVVLVKKSGYATTAKEVPITSGVTTQINIPLFQDQVSTTFSATAASNIPVSSSATVQIQANAMQTAAGTPYTGTVVVGASYYSPDTPRGVQAFAGPYIGVDAEGVKTPIISMGFMEVKLADLSGNPLQLRVNMPATLTFPRSSNSGTATTVPLWFYDEANKIWVNEGSATLQADGTFQGTVKHFTLWNADFFGARATIKGCFKDTAGNIVANVGPAGLRTTGWSHWIGGNNPDGTFTIVNAPANLPLEFYSASTPQTFATVTIPPITTGLTLTLPCVTITAPVSGSTSTVINTTPIGVFTNTGVVAGSSTGVTPTTTTTSSVTGTTTAPPASTSTGSATSTGPVTVGTSTTTSTVTNTITNTITSTLTATVTSTTTGVVGTSSVPSGSTSTSGTASFAGIYSGTYGGAETGTFNVSVGPTGLVTGTNFSQTYSQTFAVNGQVAANGSVSLTASGNAGSAKFSGAINSAGLVNGTWGYVTGLTGGGTFAGSRTASGTSGAVVAPPSTITTIITPVPFAGANADKYVGKWAGCYVNKTGLVSSTTSGVTTTFVNSTTSSSFETITFAKTGPGSLTYTLIATDFSGSTCSGVGTATQTQSGSLIIVGQKLVGVDAVDLINVNVTVVSGSALPPSATVFFKDIALVVGTTFKVGDYAGPLDVNGYPNVLDPTPWIKQ